MDFSVELVPEEDAIDDNGAEVRSSCLCLHGYGPETVAATRDLTSSNARTRFEFFKALVVGFCANQLPGSPVKGAEEIMSEIERCVEAGTLFGEVEP
jgi:hypothetical protein